MKFLANTIRLLAILTLSVFVCSSATNAQSKSKQIEMGVSLVKWQKKSPIQIVGSGLGDEGIVNDLYLFNTSNTEVKKVQFQGIVFDIENKLSKNTEDFISLESNQIDISVPPLKVIHLKNLKLWDNSMISQFVKSSKSTRFIIRLGISSSISEDGNFWQSKAVLNNFDKTVIGDTEHLQIDNLWGKIGYKQLLEIIKNEVADSKTKETKQNTAILKNKDLAKNSYSFAKTSNKKVKETSDGGHKCYANVDELSWCQLVTQDSCRTFDCEPNKHCPKNHCWKIMDIPVGGVEV
jgi:hypothetical protein